MAWYGPAVYKDVGNSCGPYKGGPPKIVLHTTEGSSAEGAFSAYSNSGCFPHFTVDETTVYQHLSTDTAASALKNLSGGVETNRWWAVQVEIVGYAGSPKNHATLELVAELCAWLEEVHHIPHEWPSGEPQGQSGPHNRDVDNWKYRGGWYAHSQVPESDHWDIGKLSDEELSILMEGGVQFVEHDINGTEQSGRVPTLVYKGNSYELVKGFRDYADNPPPTWDPDRPAVISETRKVHCQAWEGGARCAELSVEEVEVPIAGKGFALRHWLCAHHRDEALAPVKRRKKAA